MGQIIDLQGANFIDDAYPIIRNDVRLNDGSLLLVDFSHSNTGISGVPTSGTIVPNLAYESLSDLTGLDLTASGSGVRFDATGITSTSIVFERTTKGALHGMVSNTARNHIVAGLLLESGDASDAVRDYIKANPSKNYALFLWAKVTRTTTSTSNVNDSAAYMNSYSAAGNNLLASTLNNEVGLQRIALNATTGMSGSSSEDDAANKMYPFYWGQTPPYEGFNPQTGKSMILYSYHLIDVSASGKTYEELNALDLKLFNEAFAEGGRFYNDTWSDPASVLA